MRHLSDVAATKLRDKGPAGIANAAVAARTTANMLQAMAESRQRTAADERRMKEAGLVRWEET